jgi:hypothetical protein
MHLKYEIKEIEFRRNASNFILFKREWQAFYLLQIQLSYCYFKVGIKSRSVLKKKGLKGSYVPKRKEDKQAAAKEEEEEEEEEEEIECFVNCKATEK